jgi:hypothetical protein
MRAQSYWINYTEQVRSGDIRKAEMGQKR